MDLMCKCRRQEQQVSDLRKLVDEVAKLEAGAPDASGGDNSGNWETQSVCSDVSGVSRFCRGPYACLCATMQSGRVASVLPWYRTLFRKIGRSMYTTESSLIQAHWRHI